MNWPSASTPSWPTSLPWLPLLRGYSETPPNVVIRSQMDVGPAKVRRRSTAGVRIVKCIISLNYDTLNWLDTFYNTTLAGGSLQFAWYASLRRGSRDSTQGWWRFTAPPNYVARGGGYWEANLELEAMP